MFLSRTLPIPLLQIFYVRESVGGKAMADLTQGVDPPFIVWFYRLMSRAVMESFRTPGRFYKDFLNYKTSIIVQAFRLRAKKIRNWERMIQKDARCCRIRDSEGFLAYLAARQVKNA